MNYESFIQKIKDQKGRSNTSAIRGADLKVLMERSADVVEISNRGLDLDPDYQYKFFLTGDNALMAKRSFDGQPFAMLIFE